MRTTYLTVCMAISRPFLFELKMAKNTHEMVKWVMHTTRIVGRLESSMLNTINDSKRLKNHVQVSKSKDQLHIFKHISHYIVHVMAYILDFKNDEFENVEKEASTVVVYNYSDPK